MPPATTRSDAPACPGCGKPAAPVVTPFCSQGCRDRDLLQWLSDGHRIPGPPATADDFAPDALDSRD